jgi:N6-adenosine-specific RNA methylase IME4
MTKGEIVVANRVELLPRIAKPMMPAQWDYDASVKKVSRLIYKWSTLTDEMVSELWIAREMLSQVGNPRFQKENATGANAPIRTWASYCSDIGSSKRTVNRWLAKFAARSRIENGAAARQPALPAGKYNVIYADPPWKYDNSGLAGAAQEHYAVMNLDDICALPIGDKAADNSVLFCWATNPFLEDVFRVINAWGFSYKTNMCWQKEGRATYGKLGFYVYGKHELLLIAVKGSMLPKYMPESLVTAKKGKHSRKPDEFYGVIERMYPKGKYLELFARKKRSEKWSVWGLEV